MTMGGATGINMKGEGDNSYKGNDIGLTLPHLVTTTIVHLS